MDAFLTLPAWNLGYGRAIQGTQPLLPGQVIRYNRWRDIGSPMGHGAAAVSFNDGEGGDFRLRPDAKVFRRLPGFQPIPFWKIGLLDRRAE